LRSEFRRQLAYPLQAEAAARAGHQQHDAKRKLWLDTASSIFKIIYKDKQENGRSELDKMTE
jgi:hypothetical protein